MLNKYVSLVFFCTIVSGITFVLFNLNRYGEYKMYGLIFNESVSGLMVGSGVMINGVKVGIVRQISIDSDDASKAIVVIKCKLLNNEDKIEGRIGLANFMGHSFIDLRYTKNSAKLPNLIGYKQLRSTDSIMKKVTVVVEDLLSPGNMFDIQNSSKDLIKVLHNLILGAKDLTNQASGIIKNLKVSSESLNTFMKDLDQTKERVNTILDRTHEVFLGNQVQQDLNNLSEILSNTKVFTHDMKSVLDNFKKQPLRFLIHGQSENQNNIKTVIVSKPKMLNKIHVK